MPSRPRRLPRPFWFIWTALFLTKAGGFVVIVMTLYLTTRRGMSVSQAGMVVGLFGVGAGGGVLTGGVLCDRWGRKVTMVGATLLSSAALATLAEVSDLYAICALVAVFGFSNAMLSPSAIAAIADVVHPDDRDRAFNLMFWAMNLGMGLATLLAGFMAQYSYLLLFRLDAATQLAIALIVLVAVPESLNKGVTATATPQPHGRFIEVWRDGTFMTFVGLMFLQSFLIAQTQSTLPLTMTANGMSESDYGMVLAVGAMVIIGGQLLVPRLITRFSKTAVMTAALLFMTAGFGSVGLADGFAAYLLCALTWTMGSMLAAPPNATVIAELSPAMMRGRYQSVFGLTFAAANFTAPAIGGFTLDRLGQWHWAAIAGAGALAALGHRLCGPAREREAAARAAARARPAPEPATV
jgi:MFS family permease